MSSERQKVLFIGGLPRSGSTLIEKVLNELDGTFAVGETLHLWERGIRDNERCGCGDLFSECSVWNAIGEEAFDGWDNVDYERMIDLRWKIDRTRRLGEIVKAHHSGLITQEQDEYIEHLAKVLHAAAKTNPGTEVILESSKHLTTAALLALEPSLDVRVLHVVRDPRGVAYSWTKKVKRPEAEDDYMPTYRPSRSAGRWLTDNIGFELLGRSVKQETVKYEDFLEDPVSVINQVIRLAGLEGSPPLDFLSDTEADITATMHSVAGNPMRFTKSSTITFKKDEAWRKHFSKLRRAQVAAITAPLLFKYRYPLG